MSATPQGVAQISRAPGRAPCDICAMPPAIPRPLPADFSDRIAELRRIAEDRGHGDVGYLLDLARQMAAQRENAAALGPALWSTVSSDLAVEASPLLA